MISGTKLNQFIINSLEDIKAFDITVIDVRKKTSIADYMIIASANSNRQTKALARHLKDTLKEIGKSVANIEGEVDGEWVLVDLNEVLVHIMLPTTRAYFNLEELWQS
ncbi:MAG: ribosome silencing factor [Betaproteobacteria bacterium]|nr:ribosome silencing factor [Methylophilaceae bacterium]NCV28169.1 ribosome silencing factor [Nitrosomonadales bacterium]NCV38508.1 ribosome silencing factor [Betaproteobacteria bacterium]NCV54291.1 ribosome silencing factor [Betaproteobacteria bacterium]NCW62713.1 ribosome silencing factor [Betaproteobacteria bacterium]